MASHNINLTPKELNAVSSDKNLGRKLKMLQNLAREVMTLIEKSSGSFAYGETQFSNFKRSSTIDLMECPVNSIGIDISTLEEV